MRSEKPNSEWDVSEISVAEAPYFRLAKLVGYELLSGRRLLISGTVGAGKSTMVRDLGEAYSIDFIEYEVDGPHQPPETLEPGHRVDSIHGKSIDESLGRLELLGIDRLEYGIIAQIGRSGPHFYIEEIRHYPHQLGIDR